MTHKIYVYPHNDLLNLAFHQKKAITEKGKNQHQEGMALDCMGCLISLAFSVEAIINFIGHEKIPKWNERDCYKHKINLVCKTANVVFDKNKEPYKTIWNLKSIRDDVAHGKPVQREAEINNKDELHEVMKCTWDNYLNLEYIRSSYEEVIKFKRILFDEYKIKVEESITHAHGV